MPPRAQKRKPASIPPAQVPDEEPKTKRATRNSAASAGDEWMTSNTVTIQDEPDSDFDELDDAPEPESQISLFSQLSQSQSQQCEVENLPQNSPVHQMPPVLQSSPVRKASSVHKTPSVHKTSPIQQISPGGSYPSVSSGSSQHTLGNGDSFSAHPDLLTDIAAANNGDSAMQRQNVRGAMNFHLKLMLLKRRNITAVERKAFVQYVVTNTGMDTHEVSALQKHVDNVSAILHYGLGWGCQADIPSTIHISCANSAVNSKRLWICS
jgi:hypothetical protein